jgi:RNA polymerase sigma-54 factor
MKQGLQLRLSQHLALTPQLQQSIRLLQLSTLELNAEIDQALQENPLLERDDPGEPGIFALGQAGDALAHQQQASPGSSDNSPETRAGDDEGWGMSFSGSGVQRDHNDDDMDSGETQASATSLREHLGAQVGMTQMPDRERALVAFLIEALDDDGYLTQPLDELVDLLVGPEDDPDLRENLLEELGIALRHLQNLDPPGIGARGAQECLTLQLRNLEDSPERKLALAIVRNHLDQLAARDFVRIRKAQGCDDEELRDAQTLIRSLNPRPGAQYAPIDTRYVVPDVTVRKTQGQWVASLNPRGHAAPAHQPSCTPTSCNATAPATAPAAGLAGQLQEAKLADQERAAAFPDHPAGGAGHRRSPAAPVFRVRRGGDAAADPARNRRVGGACTNRRFRA